MPPCWRVPLLHPDAGLRKDAGWQWYNEKLKSREEEQLPAPAASPPQMDILEKQAALQHATKKH
jgi:conjugal transfer pilus assembly protein TraF